MSSEHLTAHLLNNNIVSAGALAQVDPQGMLAPEWLISALYRTGAATEGALARALAHVLGHPTLVLTESTVDLRPLAVLPRHVAQQHTLLPVAMDDTTVTVAVAQLDNTGAVFDQVAFAMGRSVRPLLAVRGIIEDAIGPAYQAAAGGHQVLPGLVAQSRGETTPRLEIARRAATAMPAEMELQEEVLFEEDLADGSDTLELLNETSSVLVVEDDPAIQTLLVRVLEADGYDVHAVSSGTEALEWLRRTKPDLIVLDAMLPGVHGFDICTQLKRSPMWKNVPVLMVSAIYRGWENARDIQEQHGADAFIEKPFELPYLRKKVAAFLGGELAADELSISHVLAAQKARTEAREAYKAGALDDAVAAAQAWIDHDPFSAAAYFLLGNVKNRQADLEGAMAAYERAVTFDPALFGATKNLAVVYDKLGFARRSHESWSTAATLAPDDTIRGKIEARLAARADG